MTCQYLRLGRFHVKSLDSWLFVENQGLSALRPPSHKIRICWSYREGGREFLSLYCVFYLFSHPVYSWRHLSLRPLVQEHMWVWVKPFFPNRPIRWFDFIWLRVGKRRLLWPLISLYVATAVFIYHCKDYRKITGMCVLHAAREENQFLILLKSSRCSWNFTWTK